MITLARRVLGVNVWQISDFTGSAFGDPSSFATDGHNVISVSINSDGYMHMSWGMHNNPLISMCTDCRRSTVGECIEGVFFTRRVAQVQRHGPRDRLQLGQ
jgi:hypothetical protein